MELDKTHLYLQTIHVKELTRHRRNLMSEDKTLRSWSSLERI